MSTAVRVTSSVTKCPATAYAEAVAAAKIPAGPYVRAAADRHLRDLAEGHKRGLVYRPDLAEHAISFQRFIRHSKGEWQGQILQFAPWQEFILGCAFGWTIVEDDTHRRRFQTVYEEIPKKNGKSTKCAFVGLYGLIADGEPGAEIYAAATARPQARLVFDEAVKMVKSSPDLIRAVVPLVGNLSHPASFSKFQPISADANTGDGINPHMAIVDEIHRLKKMDLVTVLRQGMGARRNPQMWIITTSGDDRPGTPYDEEHNYAVKVVTGALEDDSYFAYIACPDPDDPWDHEDTWIKANPNYGVSVKKFDMQARAKGARNSAQALADFKRFRLNVRSSDAAAAIKIENWRKGDTPAIDEAELIGRPCRMAVDLSAKTDLTCVLNLVGPREPGEPYVILPRFWMPAENVEEKSSRDRVPYRAWINAGYIKTTEGNRVDYEAVEAQIIADARRFSPPDVAFDPWNDGGMIAKLATAGISMVEFSQTTKNYAQPTKEFLGLILDGLIHHGGNPVLAWMASNLILVSDHNGNPMPSKKRSTGRIDGIAAAIMALGRFLTSDAPEPESIYNNTAARPAGLLVI